MIKDDANQWDKYASELYPLLDTYVQKHVDKVVTNYLQTAYGFFAFYTEDLRSKVISNDEYWDDASLFILYMHDNLRSLIPLHSYMHMAPSAYVLRSIFESWCTARYIFIDPQVRFPLYRDFELVEKYSAHIKGTNPIPSQAEVDNIKAKIKPWLYNDRKGQERINYNWTRDRNINLPKMAKDSKLDEHYSGIYSNASIFTHCSSVLRNSYQGRAGISPMPLNDQGALLSLMGAHYGIEFLEDFYKFFGIAFPSYEKALLGTMLLEAGKKYS